MDFRELKWNTLINIYGTAQNFDAVEFYLSEMKRRNVKADIYTLNTIIKVYGHAEHFHRVEYCIDEMERHNVMPDEKTIALLYKLPASEKMQNYFSSRITSIKKNIELTEKKNRAKKRKKLAREDDWEKFKESLL